MRNRIGLGLLISIATGCSTQPRSLTDDDSHFFQLEPATSVEVYATGGIAGLVNDWRIVANTRAFTYVSRSSCSGTCPAARDSASGTLPQPAVDSIFNVVVPRDTIGGTRDYGTTIQGADMIRYVVRVTGGSTTTDLRADDGTMPPPMREIVDVVRATIAAARK